MPWRNQERKGSMTPSNDRARLSALMAGEE